MLHEVGFKTSQKLVLSSVLHCKKSPLWPKYQTAGQQMDLLAIDLFASLYLVGVKTYCCKFVSTHMQTHCPVNCKWKGMVFRCSILVYCLCSVLEISFGLFCILLMEVCLCRKSVGLQLSHLKF
jgi:hypothetical protein